MVPSPPTTENESAGDREPENESSGDRDVAAVDREASNSRGGGSSGVGIGALLGAIVGVVAFVGGGVAGFFVWCTKKEKKNETSNDSTAQVTTTTHAGSTHPSPVSAVRHDNEAATNGTVDSGKPHQVTEEGNDPKSTFFDL